MNANSLLRTISLLFVLVFVVAGLTEHAASGENRNKTKERLIQRAELGMKAWLGGDFDTVISLRSQRMRPQSTKELEETIEMWRGFIAIEKPQVRILNAEVVGLRGRVKKEVFVQSGGDWRTAYDHWIYEKGDWYLDEADRTN
ncbi:MAG TPA: hypothetical protein VJ805_01425 [Nitrospiraceae bacterium]|nr:hypothetical protein [Nitrospiraceae bacterium]